ncbi:MAG: hypothetical protein H6732_16895 [Alphaproteobacteria bacterium]|nr:hypothetical protein [Alphaproteobacteria bacterium]
MVAGDDGQLACRPVGDLGIPRDVAFRSDLEALASQDDLDEAWSQLREAQQDIAELLGSKDAWVPLTPADARTRIWEDLGASGDDRPLELDLQSMFGVTLGAGTDRRSVASFLVDVSGSQSSSFWRDALLRLTVRGADVVRCDVLAGEDQNQGANPAHFSFTRVENLPRVQMHARSFADMRADPWSGDCVQPAPPQDPPAIPYLAGQVKDVRGRIRLLTCDDCGVP